MEEAAGFLSLSPVSTGACSKVQAPRVCGFALALVLTVVLHGLQPGANVLSIGSGLGGPARFLAGRYGVAVTAVELQPDLHAAAAELTHRCGLSAAVAHVCADVLALLPSLPVRFRLLSPGHGTFSQLVNLLGTGDDCLGVCRVSVFDICLLFVSSVMCQPLLLSDLTLGHSLPPDSLLFVLCLTRVCECACVPLALLPVGLQPDSFTGVVAWLTLLHFPPSHRATVYRHCHRVLGPGGVLYFADFFDGGGLTADERARLTKDVRCASLPTLEQCAADVTAAGFVDVVTRDVTADWVSSTAARADAFQRDRERFLAVTHGRAGVFARLSQFYCLIAALFAGGHLGGVVVTARKPS